jgi:hypothetical protein
MTKFSVKLWLVPLAPDVVEPVVVPVVVVAVAEDELPIFIVPEQSEFTE